MRGALLSTTQIVLRRAVNSILSVTSDGVGDRAQFEEFAVFAVGKRGEMMRRQKSSRLNR